MSEKKKERTNRPYRPKTIQWRDPHPTEDAAGKPVDEKAKKKRHNPWNNGMDPEKASETTGP